MMTDFVPLWRRALTAEVCWLDADGVPGAAAATPLLDQGVPCVAVPYARAHEVSGLRGARQVAFTVTDSRSVPAAEPGLARLGVAEVLDDTEGDHFTVELLGEELLKYPPSRALADSPLLCRENWWWLPRIIVRLTAVQETLRLPVRTNPARHGLLVREDGTRLSPRTVDVEPLDGAEPDRNVRLRALDGAALRGDGGTGMVLGHDYTIPDFERWETWSAMGPLWGERLEAGTRHGAQDAELAPLRLLQRIRRQRALAQRCKRNIVAAEKHR